MNYLPLLIAGLLCFSGAAVILVVYWLAKRSRAREDGATPPTLLQTLRGIIKPQDGGPGHPRPPA